MRVLLGVVAILVALPLLLGGVALWAAMQHRADDGSFTASLAPMHTSGYAVVVPDVDTLLRREAPFVRGGQTTLRFTARTGSGAAFIGLAPRAAVERYLTGVSYAAVSQIRLARGGLPVNLTPVPGSFAPPSPPVDQTFWLVSSTSGTLFWSPSDLRGDQLALVVMNPSGAQAGEVSASAAMMPRWLDPTTWGLLILGTVAFLIGMVLLFWPRRQREIVYVVEPSQVPEIAARLGISTEPLAAALGGVPDPFDLLGPRDGTDDPEPDALASSVPGAAQAAPGSASAAPGMAAPGMAASVSGAAVSAGHAEAAMLGGLAVPAGPGVAHSAGPYPAGPVAHSAGPYPAGPGVAQQVAHSAGPYPAGPGVAHSAVEPPAWLVSPDTVGAPPAPISPSPTLPQDSSVAHLMAGGVIVAPSEGHDRGFGTGNVAPPAMPYPNGDQAGGAAGQAGGAGYASQAHAAGMPIWAGPTPVPTGQPGTYRSFTAPPPITPSFVWPPVPAPPADTNAGRPVQ
ncbi:MAG: hypothetical protein AUI14_15935 [Actinobacteria bacterium 13_2_20CM_2_71_6]|nr:MAG: hypothetical protein AUI14_15935 [Actinobacteria bacterium 13_2_20CM_2_71_6]